MKPVENGLMPTGYDLLPTGFKVFPSPFCRWLCETFNLTRAFIMAPRPSANIFQLIQKLRAMASWIEAHLAAGGA